MATNLFYFNNISVLLILRKNNLTKIQVKANDNWMKFIYTTYIKYTDIKVK